MVYLCVFLLLTIPHTLAYDIKECNDGVLIVGGKNPSGPSSKITLLKPTGVCEHSGFQDLPEPLVSPAANYSRNRLFVCGFSGNVPCKYTERGWNIWYDSSETTGDQNFHKMVYSDKTGSVLMTSNGNGNHLQFNPYNPYHPYFMSMVGSPFSVGGSDRHHSTDISQSCLVAYDGDLLLLGGRASLGCYRCSGYETVPYVGKWSVSGRADGMGPPEFENGLVEDMIEAREAHACAEFDDGVIVSGGYRYTHYTSPFGPPQPPNTELKASAEFYDGATWMKMQNMGSVRSFHQLQTMCGAAVAIGGVDLSDGETLLDTVEQAWSAFGQWILSPYMNLPEPLAYAASSPVNNMDCWTGEE